MFFFLLGSISVLIAIALIFAVVIQKSKGGGLSATFAGGGATQLLGSRRSNEFIEKVTWYLAAGLAIIAIVANIVGNTVPLDENALRMGTSLDEQVIFDPTALPDNSTLETTTPPAPEQ